MYTNAFPHRPRPHKDKVHCRNRCFSGSAFKGCPHEHRSSYWETSVCTWLASRPPQQQDSYWETLLIVVHPAVPSVGIPNFCSSNITRTKIRNSYWRNGRVDDNKQSFPVGVLLLRWTARESGTYRSFPVGAPVLVWASFESTTRKAPVPAMHFIFMWPRPVWESVGIHWCVQLHRRNLSQRNRTYHHSVSSRYIYQRYPESTCQS